MVSSAHSRGSGCGNFMCRASVAGAPRKFGNFMRCAGETRGAGPFAATTRGDPLWGLQGVMVRVWLQALSLDVIRSCHIPLV